VLRYARRIEQKWNDKKMIGKITNLYGSLSGRHVMISGSFPVLTPLRTPRAQEATTFVKKMDWKNGKGNYGPESSCYNVPPL
jgi:hypothetical protein